MLLLRILTIVGSGAGFLCRWSTMSFMGILGISAGRPWLIPVALLLLPLGIPLLFIAFLTYPLAFVCGVLLLREKGIQAHADAAGLELRTGRGGGCRLIPWSELREIHTVWAPPVHTYRAILTSGEVVPFDILGHSKAKQAIEAHGIPFHGLRWDLDRELGDAAEQGDEADER